MSFIRINKRVNGMEITYDEWGDKIFNGVFVVIGIDWPSATTWVEDGNGDVYKATNVDGMILLEQDDRKNVKYKFR